MKLNDLKRKAFFWIDRLQISRTERVAVVTLLVLVSILLVSNLFLTKTYNFSQEKYDAITEKFEERSRQLKEEQKQIAQKYNPELAVTEPEPTENPEQIEETSVLPAVTTDSKININTATNSELQLLDGIGEAYAQRIIEYREANGGFDSIDELVNVKGIGEKRLENIRPFITLHE
jgi:comEA protein